MQLCAEGGGGRTAEGRAWRDAIALEWNTIDRTFEMDISNVTLALQSFTASAVRPSRA